MAVARRQKRTAQEIEEDTIYAYKRRLTSTASYREIAEEISANRDYTITFQTVHADVGSMDVTKYVSLISADIERADAALFFSTVSSEMIGRGIETGDTNMIRLAMDARWKVHQIAQEEYRNMLEIFEGADMDLVTPEFRKRVMELFKEINVDPTRKFRAGLPGSRGRTVEV